MIAFSLNAKAQYSQTDITISINTTWTNEERQLTNNQKIIITNGATLTMVDCYLHRKSLCPGYWDGIYLVTAENGAKAGLIVNDGTRIEYSRNGIQAVNGFSQITLDDAKMSDNGTIINARDNWPFANYYNPFTSYAVSSRDGGGPTSPYDIGCDELLSPAPPKVVIRNHCVLKVLENGNNSVDPAKWPTQISTLGAELNVINSDILNGVSTEDRHLAAIAASRGKCKIMGDSIDGFWIGIYKGTDQSALCVSEGLVLTGSKIKNTDLTDDPYYAPGWAVLNVSANAMIKANVIEGNVWSLGTSYGNLMRNNIKNGNDAEVPKPSVYLIGPRVSFSVFDNKFDGIATEYDMNNNLTYATCNFWEDEVYAVVAGAQNYFPRSWGTLSRSSGNVWWTNQSEMYNLSAYDNNFDYYYKPITHEIFNWYDGFTEHSTSNPNTYCAYAWPSDATELDPEEYVVDIEDLTEQYEETQEAIESIIGHMDTTVLTVKEELAYLKSKLSDLVGQGLLFHTTRDDDFWVDQVDSNVVELLGLNYLWYGGDMYSITEHLDSNPDPDAEALFDAANKMSDYLNNGKNLCNLTALQVDTLQTFAESSFGNYTNILRNYLFMMYDVFIPWEGQSPLDSILSRSPIYSPSDKPAGVSFDYVVGPNPFTDVLQIHSLQRALEVGSNNISIYSLDGILLFSATLAGDSGNINLSTLEPGFYIVKIENEDTGKIEVKRIYKSHK